MTDNPQQAALKPYRERILALLDKEVAFAEKHLGSYDTEWMKGIRALVMSEPEVSSTPAPVDHAALAEEKKRPKLGRSDWVNCPICGESDMRKQIDPDSDDGEGYIYCVNTNCGGNGGDNFAALRAHPAGGVSEDGLRAAAMVISPNCCWDGEPPNSYQERRIELAMDKARRALRAAGIGAGVVENDK